MDAQYDSGTSGSATFSIQQLAFSFIMRIIVYHYSPAARVPTLTPDQCAQIRRKYDVALKDYPGVSLKGVFVDGNGQGICEWEAPSVAVVNEVITKVDGAPPVDGAVAVQKII
jgi:hypothetical protein